MSKRKTSVCCHGRINKNSAFQVFGKTLLLIRCMEMSLFSQKTQDVHGFGILFPSETVRLSKTITVVSEKGQQKQEGGKEQEREGRVMLINPSGALATGRHCSERFANIHSRVSIVSFSVLQIRKLRQEI